MTKPHPDKHIEHLRMIFRISCAAFDFKNQILAALGKVPPPYHMETLHRLMLMELEKQEPDMSVVHSLLKEMEEQTKLRQP